MARQTTTDLYETASPAGLPTTHSTSSFWHTQPSKLLIGYRSTRNLPTEVDIAIIGSGITGASIAHHLLNPDQEQAENANDAVNVVMLEAREACWGATGRNGGHCQPLLFEHPHDPSIGRFELDNFYTLQGLIRKHSIPCEFFEQPGVRAILSRHHLEEAKKALRKVKDVSPDLYQRIRLVTDKNELADLRIPAAVGAIVTDVAARLWPYKLVVAILEQLLTNPKMKNQSTFNLQTLTPAESLTRHPDGNRWLINTPRGEIIARKVILATNAYTSYLLPSFASLIVPCRGQMSALVPLPSVAGHNRLATSFSFLGDGLDDYLIQRPNETGGHLMFGGGRQHGPSLGTVDDSVIDDQVAAYLRSRLVGALALPEGEQVKMHSPQLSSHNGKKVEFAAANQWTGIMGFSRDEHPFVGPVPGNMAPDADQRGVEGHSEAESGIFISAGYTGHGMPNAWLCGKAIALMTTCASEDVKITPSDVADQLGLPECYLVTSERLRKALESEESVAARDLREMRRGEAARREIQARVRT